MNVAKKLPDSWLWVKLEDVGRVASGGTPKTSDSSNFDGPIAWVTPADLTGYSKTYIERGERNISLKGLKGSSARILPVGTVLFSSRAPIGYVVIAANELSTNQGFKNLTPGEGINSQYVYYYLKGSKKLAESMASGTTFLEISGRRFSQLPIPLAPLAEQGRIVSKIEELFSDLDAGEASLRKAQKLIATYRQSVFKAALTGKLLESAGSSWRQFKVGDLLTDIRYGTAKKCSYDPSKTPVLRIPNVVSGKINLSELKHTDFEASELNKLKLREGDLLLVRSNGSADLVARSAVVGPEAKGYAYAGYLIRLRLQTDKVLPQFLHLFFYSPITRSYIKRQARSTSGVHNINGDEIKNLVLRLPSLEVQSEIIDKVEELFSRIDTLETWCRTELARSASLRQSILKAAFSGQLVPQDPNDEPANVLLERIRAERNGQSAKQNGHKPPSTEQPAKKRGRKPRAEQQPSDEQLEQLELL